MGFLQEDRKFMTDDTIAMVAAGRTESIFTVDRNSYRKTTMFAEDLVEQMNDIHSTPLHVGFLHLFKGVELKNRTDAAIAEKRS